MQLPFRLFANVGLGTAVSSQQFITLHDARTINTHKTQLFVNAATGNTVVQDTLFNVQDDGMDLSVGMLWNAADHRWRFAMGSKIILPPVSLKYGFKFLSNPVISIAEADGRVIEYAFDRSSDCYIAKEDGGQGKSFLRREEEGFARFSPVTGAIEKYTLEGRLTETILPNGKKIHYGQDENGEVNAIRLPSQRQIKLIENEEHSGQYYLALYANDKKTYDFATYIFKDKKRIGGLKKIIIQPDGFVAEMNYDFQNAIDGNAVLTINCEGALQTLGFDPVGKLKTLCVGDEKQDETEAWTFQFSKDQCTVTDQCHHQYEVGVDANKHLTRFKSPTDASPKLFDVDVKGRLLRLKDNANAEQEFNYHETLGLESRHIDTLGRQTETIYEEGNPLLLGLQLAELTYEDRHVQLEGSGSPIAAQFFVYNHKRQKCYAISPEGRVTQFSYVDDRLAAIKKVRTILFKIAPRHYKDKEKYSLAVLDNWWQSLSNNDLRHLYVTQICHDQYGRENLITRYTQVTSTGQGIEECKDNACIQHRLDEVGRVAIAKEALSYQPQASEYQETQTQYDKLDRPLVLKEGSSFDPVNKRETQYQYRGHQTTLKHANGLLETASVDSRFLFRKKTRASADGAIVRTEKRLYKAHQGLSEIEHEDGQKEYHWQDAAGRLKFKLRPEGEMLEYDYSLSGKMTCCKAYEKLKWPINPTLDVEAQLASQRLALANYQLYDSEEQLRFEVNVKKVANRDGSSSAQGFVVEHEYKLGNRVRTIRYQHPLTNLEHIDYPHLSRFCTNEQCSSPKIDRETRFFYDLDHLLIAEQMLADYVPGKTPLGYLKRYERDGAGDIVHEIIYLDKSPLADDLIAATPKTVNTIETWHKRDNAGRCIATLDDEGYLTAYTYYANGNIKAEYTFGSPLQINKAHVHLAELQLPDLNAAGQVIEYTYDGLGRKQTITNSQNHLRISIEYDAADHEIKVTQTDLLSQTERVLQKDYTIFGELVHEATARISASAGADQSQWTYYQVDPQTGLRRSTTDALGHMTFFFYDKARRPVLEIGPRGEVITFVYASTHDEPTEIRRYINRLDLRSFKHPNNPFMDKAVLDQLPTVDDDKDEVRLQTLDGEGLPIMITHPHKGKQQFYYNSYNEIATEWEEIEEGKTLQKDHEHDLRGNLTRTLVDPGHLNSHAAKQYDALNRLTEKINALGHRIAIRYPSLRTQVWQDEERTKTLKKDAFLRLLAETDWENKEHINHTYDDVNRTRVSRSAAGSCVRETQNAFDEVVCIDDNGQVTAFERGVDGQIEKLIGAEGCEEKTHYTLLGQPDEHVAANGKLTRYGYDAAGHLEKTIEDPEGENRITSQLTNALGQIEKIQSAAGLIQTTAIAAATCSKTETIDPDHCKLETRYYCNYQAGITRMQQGDAQDHYEERITRDLLNREIERRIVMDEHTSLLLKQQTYDALGHVVAVQDGKGQVTRHVYDGCGRLRFTLDAEGFVTERRYDCNDNAVSSRQYKQALAADKLLTLAAQSTPQTIASLVTMTAEDALTHRLFNSDKHLRFEITALENDQAKVVEYRRDAKGKCTCRIEYACPLKLDHLPNLQELEKQLEQPAFAVDPKNRRLDFCRDKNGRVRFIKDGECYVTEKRHDVDGKVIAFIRYADRYPHLDVTQAPAQLATQLKLNNSLNRKNYFIYDLFGNLRYDIDGEGFVRAYQYDKDNNQTDLCGYFHPLTSEVLSNLAIELHQSGADREGAKIRALMAQATAAIADPAKDVHHHYKHDSGGRDTGEIDGEGHEDFIYPNALGLPVKRMDKCGHEWITRFDSAKRMVVQESPPIEITLITQNAATGRLEAHQKHTQVAAQMIYDAASNPERSIFAANIPSEQREIISRFDKKNQFIGTVITGVKIDDGNDALPLNHERPEIEATITTQKILDYAGREIVSIDENQIATYTIYDSAHRERFHVDGEGYVTEFCYADTFSLPTQIIKHDMALEKNMLARHPQGFSLQEMTQLTLAFDPQARRTLTYAYDHRGLKRAETKDAVVIGVKANDGNIKPKQFCPQRLWTWNAFGEIKTEIERIDASSSAKKQFFHDRNGNLILMISPCGFVTAQQFGMKNLDTNKPQHILLKRIEYAEKLAAEVLEQGSIPDVPTHPKDRTFKYDYDRNLRQLAETLSSQDEFQVAGSTATTTAITHRKAYDNEGRLSALGLPNGDERYLLRNARGEVIYETEFPFATDLAVLENGSPKRHVVLTQHLINAHQQAVGTIRFAHPISIDKKDQRVELKVPDASAQDETTLLLMDNRGCNTVTQTPAKNLNHSTFDGTRKPIRKYHGYTGYQLKEGQPTRVTHLNYVQQQFDRKHRPTLLARGDETALIRTYKKYNAHDECIGEGPSPEQMMVERAFDRAGHQYYSNEDKGIPTLTLNDGRGAAVAVLRSKNEINRANYRDGAFADLLTFPYEQSYQQLQRTVFNRDAEANIVTWEMPWYTGKPKDEPGLIQVSFHIEYRADRVFIVWPLQDEKLITPQFRYRIKGSEPWHRLPIEELKNEVEVTELHTDTYEYQLDFHLQEPGQMPFATPTYRALGEVNLDTGQDEASKNIVWYLQDQTTLILCGNIAEVTGIELSLKGRRVKRLAGTTEQPGKMRIDLSEELSGDYEFKAVKGFASADPAPINFYRPVYHLNQSLTPEAGSFPPNVQLSADIVPITAPLPYHPQGSYNYKLYGRYNKTFNIGTPLPGVYTYASDAEGNRYFLDYAAARAARSNDGYPNYYNGYQPSLSPYIGREFFLLHDSGIPHPQAILDSSVLPAIATIQITSWANHAYLFRTPSRGIPVPINIDAAAMTETLGTLSVRTKQASGVMTAREIVVYDFAIYTYCISGFLKNKAAANTPCTYYSYDWKGSISLQGHLRVQHNAVAADIYPTYMLPSIPAYERLNASNFQTFSYPPADLAGTLNLTLVCTEEGVDIPMDSALQPMYEATNPGRFPVIPVDDYLEYDGELQGISHYPDVHCLYFRPVPSSVHAMAVQFEYLMTTVTGQKVWLELPCAHNAKGLVVNVSGLKPDYYQYRFRNCATKELIDLNSVGIELKNEGHGSVLVGNGRPGNRVFVSQHMSPKLEIKKPIIKAAYDHWRNITQEINACGGLTAHEFNLFNREIATKTPAVPVTTVDNITFTQSLQTRALYDTNNDQVAAITPNGGRAERIVNYYGDTLQTRDADGVQQTFTVDTFHRKSSLTGPKGNKTSIQYHRQAGLKIETYILPNQKTASHEINEDDQCIRTQDSLGREDFYDHDSHGHETLAINPKLATREQRFDQRNGVRLSLKDEDDNRKTWDTGPAGSVDHYFGNVNAYTDFSGQKIIYTLNQNKQVESEVGDLGGVYRSRGQVHVNGEAPRAKNIRRIHDEAGHEVEIFDQGTGVMTRKRYDLAGYCEAFYFLNKDAHVYQATFTEFDLLHRITKLLDTRIAIHYGYDENSNRRCAIAYLIEDLAHYSLRHSWHAYTAANRPLIRDGDFIDGQITLTPKQGIKFDYADGEVSQQMTLSPEGKLQVKTLAYNDPLRLWTDAQTQEGEEVIAKLHREWDAGERCVRVVQEKGCAVLMGLNKPDKYAYYRYTQPTYALIIRERYWALYFYNHAEEAQITLDHDHIKALTDGLKRLKGRDANQLSAEEIAAFKQAIRDYHYQGNGKLSVDEVEYDAADNSIRRQVHTEQGGKRQHTREVVAKLPSGRPLSEKSRDFQAFEDKNKSTVSVEDRSDTAYCYGDEVRVQSITTAREKIETTHEARSSQAPPPAKFTTLEDANGHYTAVEGSLPGSNQAFVVNSDNSVVLKQREGERNYYFYAEKQPGKTVLMAYFGDIPDDVAYRLKESGYEPPVINLDINHHALSAHYPPAAPAVFVASQRMTYSQIAEALNYTGYAASIAVANGGDPEQAVEAGTRVSIPPLYMEVPDTAWNGDEVSIDSIMGSLYPTLPAPAVSFKPQRVNYLELYIITTAMVAVMVSAPYLFAGMMGVALGGGAAATGASAWQAAVAYGASAALANATGQGIALGFGSQRKFNCPSFAANTLAAAVSAGVFQASGIGVQSGSALRDFSAAQLSKSIVTAEAAALAQEAALLATGLQKEMNYKGLALAGLNGAMGYGTSGLTNPVLNTGINTLINQAASGMLYHHNLDAGTAVNTLGAMVGTYAGGYLQQNLQHQQQVFREEQQPIPAATPHAVAKVGQPEKSVQRVNPPKSMAKRPATSVDEIALTEAAVNMELPDPALPFSHTEPALDTDALNENSTLTRVEGALQVLGGIGGLAASAAFDLTGAGALIGMPLGLSSADNVVSGAKKLWSGQAAPSNLAQAASYLGFNPKTTEDALFALDIAGPLGASRAIPKLLISSNRLFGETPSVMRQGLQRHGFFGGRNTVKEVVKGLGGNPFKGKSFEEVDKILTERGFKKTGPNPAFGKGSYFNPESGRKYYLDRGGVYKEGIELPHVDIHRMESGVNLEKTGKHRYPIGEKLVEESLKRRGKNVNF